MIDRSTEFGKRVERRLENEVVGWLTTVSPSGQPTPVPIWFLWQDDETILMYSRPDTPKLRNIASNPRVSFTFDSDGTGGDIVRLQGTAEVADDVPPANRVPEFISKYQDRLPRMDFTPESFAGMYSVPVRLTPAKLWGF